MGEFDFGANKYDRGGARFHSFSALIDHINRISFDEMFMINPKRIQEILKVSESLESGMRIVCREVEICYELDEFDKSRGMIHLEGPAVKFFWANDFATALRLASNAEVHTLENGNVEVTFNFDDFLVF